MSQPYPGHIHFAFVPNFRDLGGYRTHDGCTVAWRRLFRSAALHKMNDCDMARVKQEISPRAGGSFFAPTEILDQVNAMIGEFVAAL